MTKIYGKNKKLGYRHEKAAMEGLKSKGYKVGKASFLHDVRDKCDLLATSPSGKQFAIQVKSAIWDMEEGDQRILKDWAERHNKLPRIVVVGGGFRCHLKKLPIDKEEVDHEA